MIQTTWIDQKTLRLDRCGVFCFTRGMHKLLQRKVNKVASVEIGRGKDRFSPLMYIIVDIPEKNFKAPQWNPGEGYVQVHDCAYAKVTEHEATFIVGPLFEPGSESMSYDDDNAFVWNRTLSQPFDWDDEYRFAESVNKPRRTITGDDMDSLEKVPYQGHPWKDVHEFWDDFLFEHGFEPMRILGLTPEDWDFHDMESNLIQAPKGHLSVVFAITADEWTHSEDYATVRAAVKVARRWGGKPRIESAHHYLRTSNTLPWLL